ncbi:MAG: hypothetical protein HYU60_01815 [Magnetospirillum sp.]|nr:hypothetical protein [Magnetospirillum sp.]
MWWSNSSKMLTVVAVVAATGLSGCGFRPLYARGGAQDGQSTVAAEMGGVRIAGIDNRLGQDLRNALLARITPTGEPANPRYTLAVALTQNEGGLGYRKDTFATMAEMRLTARIVLSDEDEGASVSGSEEALVSFDYLGPRYASIAMERDAANRAVTELADRIANRVGLALSGQMRWRKPGDRAE